MWVNRPVIIGQYKNIIPDLLERLRAEIDGEDIRIVKVAQNKGNIIAVEYEYLQRKTKTANKQKEEESEYSIRAAVDKLYKESFN